MVKLNAAKLQVRCDALRRWMDVVILQRQVQQIQQFGFLSSLVEVLFSFCRNAKFPVFDLLDEVTSQTLTTKVVRQLH